MEQIYWITRLDGIITFLGVVLFLSLTALCIFSVIYLITYDDEDFFKKRIITLKRIISTSFFASVISAIGLIFIPTSREVMMIYAIGGAVDYIKDNEKVEDLPDKVIDVIDAYVESLKKNSDK